MRSCLFLVALWSPAGKGLTSWRSCLLLFVTFPIMSWSTSEVRAILSPRKWFKFFSKIFFTDRSKAVLNCGSFVLFMSCVCHSFTSVHCYFVVPAGKGLTSWLLFVMFIVFLLLFHVVSWVRCGT